MGYAASKPFYFFITLFSTILVLVVFVLELLPKPQSDYELINGDENVIIPIINFDLFIIEVLRRINYKLFIA